MPERAPSRRSASPMCPIFRKALSGIRHSDRRWPFFYMVEHAYPFTYMIALGIILLPLFLRARTHRFSDPISAATCLLLPRLRLHAGWRPGDHELACISANLGRHPAAIIWSGDGHSSPI